MNCIANGLILYTREQLIDFICKCTYRTAPGDFSKESTLDFKTTALLTLNMIKKSIKAEIMSYFPIINKEIETPSRQAFTQAREKIKYTLFKDFFEKSCELATNNNEAKLFKRYRLFAIDGTSFLVGPMDKLKEYFGESTTIPGNAMCRISAVVDIPNDYIVNACVSPYSAGERVLAIKQIEELKNVSNALFLFDRGYWSTELTGKIISNNQKFVMRLASNTGKTIIKDETGEIFKLRRYSFSLPSGELEVLLTNLTEDEISNDELAALYAKRWGIETKYLELKSRLQIDKFSGESINIVLQDIYSTLYISNLVAFLCLESDEIIKEKTAGKNNKYAQKTNRSLCISNLRDRFVFICLIADDIARDAALLHLCSEISKNVTYIDKSKPRPRDKRHIKNSRLFYNKSVL